MVGNDDVLIDLGDGIYIIEHTPQDRTIADFEQRFGEVLGQFAQTGCISCC